MSNFKTDKSNNVRHRAYYFSLSVIDFVRGFPDSRIYSIFTSQLLRAATSIGANLVEAKSSSSRKDFARFYEIALKSSHETVYWLYLLRDGKLVRENNVAPMIKEAEEIGNMIGSSLLTMKGKK
jgi:four helix bundle protein